MELKQLLDKVEQGIKDRGYAVVWSTDRLTDLYIQTTRETCLPDGTNAVTNWVHKEVIIRTDLDEWETVRSLTHELGHVIMNTKVHDGQSPRSEWEAECFSQAVLEHYGLDISDVHSEYLDGYDPDHNFAMHFLYGNLDKASAIADANKAALAFVSA